MVLVKNLTIAAIITTILGKRILYYEAVPGFLCVILKLHSADHFLVYASI